MTPDPPPSRRAWLVVVLLWAVVCSNFITRFMLVTMHGSILKSFPMTEAEFGLLTAVFLWAYGLLSPFAGFVADRFSRSRVIVASLCAWSAITWLTSFARSFEQLLVLRALVGVSEACYLPAALALIADYHRGPTRSLATGVHQTGIVAGSIVGSLGGWLAEQRSWHYAFSLVGLAGLCYGALLLFVLRDAPRDGHLETPGAEARPRVRFGEALVSLFKQGSFVLVLIYWAMLGIAGWTVSAWMPVFFQERFHLGQGAAGVTANGYTALAALPGMLIGGIWADRWSRTNGRGRMLVPAIGLLIGAPCLLLTARSGLIGLAVIGLIFYRLFGCFSESNMMPILCEIVDRRYRATGYGLLNMTGTIAAGAGIYAAGALRDRRFGMSMVFEAVAAIMMLCVPLLLLMRPRTSATPVAVEALAGGRSVGG